MSETLTPKELAAEGEAAYRAKRYAAAASAYERASQAYQRSGDSLSAAEAANNSSVAYLQAGNPQKALQMAEGTQDVFAEAGDLRRQGMAFANQAAALEALNRLKDAIEQYTQAADLLKQSGDRELRAMVLQNISSLQLRTGSQLQAMATMDSALENKPKLTFKEKFLKKLLKIPFDMLNRR